MNTFLQNKALEFVETIGDSIYKSGMCGATNEHQGRMLALMCLRRNCDPGDLAATYHLIAGKLSMRADAMLADFRKSGGEHYVLQRDAEGAVIRVDKNGETNTFGLTWEEAKQEPFPWGRRDKKTGEREIKTNWETPRARMQMLWARVVSDAIRTVAPEIVAGTYTPEELELPDVADAVEEPAGEETETDSPAATSFPAESIEVSQGDDDEYCNANDSRRISQLFLLLKVNAETRQKILDKRNVNSVRSMTRDQALQLIESLEAKAEQKGITVPPLDEFSKVPPDAPAVQTDGPILQATIDGCKDFLRLLKTETDVDDPRATLRRLMLPKERLADLTEREGCNVRDELNRLYLDHRLSVSKQIPF